MNKPSLIQKPFYFIRHGETEWNVKSLYTGQSDIPLNKNGINQAHEAGTILKNVPITGVYHSSLQRARHTAEIINTYINCPMIEIKELNEANWGPFEGKPKALWKNRAEWWEGETTKDVESYHDFATRMLKSLNMVLAQEEGIPLIVGHGAFYAVFQRYLFNTLSFSLKNATPIFHQPTETEWIIKTIQATLEDQSE